MRRSSCLAFLALLGAGLLPLRADQPPPFQERADRFLELVNASYQALITLRESTDWDATTDVTPANEAAAKTAAQAFGAFVGNPALIAEVRTLLARRAELTPDAVRQLEVLLLAAAEAPMSEM